MNDIIISYKNVTVTNEATPVLKNLDFTIARGEHWALLGDAASGIPTLLQAIAGKTRVIGGEVILPASAVLVSNTSHFKNRSNTTDFYYQQRFNSSDAAKAFTLTEYLLAVKPLRQSNTWTTQTILKHLRLQQLADKPIIMLSNGETRRLLLAEAILKNPELLLLDNPLAGLDVASRENFNDLIEDIITSGIHVVMSTGADEIPDALTHVAVFEDNALKQLFTATDFARNNNPTATADFDTTQLDILISGWEIPNFKQLISLEDVTIRYGEKTILSNISWQLQQGSHCVIKGHNGAGKSTLLSLINGDNPQSYANKITLFDIKRGSGESIWDIKKHIGFASAELPRFFPKEQSCSEVIESGLYDTMGLFRRQNPANLQLILQWMDVMGIEGFAFAAFSTAPLSVQRLALLIRAFIKKPALIILDEPCQGLDKHQVALVKNTINHLCKSTGTTLLYVSHYDNEIPECATNTLLIAEGRIIANTL